MLFRFLDSENEYCKSYVWLVMSSGKRLMLPQEYLCDYKMKVNEKHLLMPSLLVKVLYSGKYGSKVTIYVTS